jgi:hypothetical protein
MLVKKAESFHVVSIIDADNVGNVVKLDIDSSVAMTEDFLLFLYKSELAN